MVREDQIVPVPVKERLGHVCALGMGLRQTDLSVFYTLTVWEGNRDELLLKSSSCRP